MRKNTLIENCRICSGNLVNVFNLGKQPLANSLNKKKNDKENFFFLELVFCKKCKVVQLSQTINKSSLFKNYIWNTGVSSTALKFSEYFFEIVKKKYFINNKRFVLEIASNDGTFLKPFQDNGHKVLGIDPASNIIKLAKKNKIKTINNFFDTKEAKKILSTHGYSDFVFARNVIPHVENINDVINGLRIVMDNESIGAIEFHYSRKILEKNQYDSIYHEHIFYFSLTTIQNLLKRHNLHIFDCLESKISGGSLIVFFSKKKKKNSEFFLKLLTFEKKNKINHYKTWKSFAINSTNHKEIFLNSLDKLVEKYHKIVGYGASARSSTFLNFCKINSSKIKYILDKSGLKKNMFTPGSKIKILDPRIIKKNRPDLILILAWNFFKEISFYLKYTLKYEGDFFVAFPRTKIIKNHEI